MRPSANTRPRRGLRITRARGSEFWDDAGKRYIDLSSQTVNAIMGQNFPALTAAVTEALQNYTFLDQDFDCDLYARAYDYLSALLPAHLTIANLKMNDGSSAVEAAVKQARRRTGKAGILTVRGIYLGQNAQVIHFRGLGERPFDILRGGTEDVIFAPMPYPDYSIPLEDAPDENGTSIAALIAKHADRLAATIVDPVMLSSGVFAGRGMHLFCQAASDACRENGVPLIVDECQSFGWVEGHSLSARWNLMPDMLCLGKSLAGGLPLSICASRPEFDNLEFGEADYTTGGGIASIAAFCAVSEALLAPSDPLRFANLVHHFESRLTKEAEARSANVRTRGIGMLRCVEISGLGDLQAHVATVRRIAAEAQRSGIYVRTYGPHLGLKPSRMISTALLDEGLDILFEVIDRVICRSLQLQDIPQSTGFSY